MSKPGEFDLIAEYFAPLARTNPGAMALTDDVALIAGTDLVVTKDMLIEGVHFRAADPLGRVAQKLLRVNISDLAAKGVRPEGYFLACAWPASTSAADIEAFAAGLAKDQAHYKCVLYGGDTTRNRDDAAPLVLSLTLFGRRHKTGADDLGFISRDEAAGGEDVWMTGTIGDAGLGLRVLEGALNMEDTHRQMLIDRYQLPTPRVGFGSALATLASASIDVSDGLFADAGHLAHHSGVDVEVQLMSLPLSDAARVCPDFERDEEEFRLEAGSAGDDYEILFTAPVSMRRSVEMAANVSRTPVTRIGCTRTKSSEKGAVLVRGNNADLKTIASRGYHHF